jgi:hypothetical protein
MLIAFPVTCYTGTLAGFAVYAAIGHLFWLNLAIALRDRSFPPVEWSMHIALCHDRAQPGGLAYRPGGGEAVRHGVR